LPVLGPPIATVIPVALKPKEGSLMKRIAILTAAAAAAAAVEALSLEDSETEGKVDLVIEETAAE
jgi:hypothetical protein